MKKFLFEVCFMLFESSARNTCKNFSKSSLKIRET